MLLESSPSRLCSRFSSLTIFNLSCPEISLFIYVSQIKYFMICINCGLQDHKPAAGICLLLSAFSQEEEGKGGGTL